MRVVRLFWSLFM